MAMAAARRALLAHLRVPAVHPAAAAGTILAARRLLSSTTEGTKGSFLDKGEVADRVLSVVKNFQKVEPSKVSVIYLFSADASTAARTFCSVRGSGSVLDGLGF